MRESTAAIVASVVETTSHQVVPHQQHLDHEETFYTKRLLLVL